MDAEILERRHTRRLQLMLFGMAAGTLGFTAVLLLQVILLVGNDVLGKLAGVEVTVDFVVNLTISVGVIAALGRFLYLNR